MTRFAMTPFVRSRRTRVSRKGSAKINSSGCWRLLYGGIGVSLGWRMTTALSNPFAFCSDALSFFLFSLFNLRPTSLRSGPSTRRVSVRLYVRPRHECLGRTVPLHDAKRAGGFLLLYPLHRGLLPALRSAHPGWRSSWITGKCMRPPLLVSRTASESRLGSS